MNKTLNKRMNRMKSLLIVAALSLTGCGLVPYGTPGVSTLNMQEAKGLRKDSEGVHVVNSTVVGFTAFCNNNDTFKL